MPPFKTFDADGTPVPLYILRFDAHGLDESPETRAELLREVRHATHVVLVSHGWNNTFDDALALYSSFAEGVMATCRDHGPVSADARPLIVGISWPSIALTLSNGPDVAGPGETPVEVRFLAEQLDDSTRFEQLAAKGHLDAGEIEELAQTLGRLHPDGSDALLELWGAATPAAPPNPFDFDDGNAGPVDSAGWLARFDPRWAYRMLTVLQMKDRAGVVGLVGVGPLLQDLLQSTSASVHLVGHSYGCKVVLTALCEGNLPRSVRSALLLQPAVNHFCFASPLPDEAGDGGFRGALERLEQPVVSTFSKRDVPLRTLFHLGVRRESDLGELQFAGKSVPRFGALGGWGPQGDGLDVRTLPLPDGGTPYDLSGADVIALRGHVGISGHSDIDTPALHWALYTQMAAS